MLMQLSMNHQSRVTAFIDTSRPEHQMDVLKFKADRQALVGDSKDVMKLSMVDHSKLYHVQRRQQINACEDARPDLSLIEFSTLYTCNRKDDGDKNVEERAQEPQQWNAERQIDDLAR